MHPDEQDLSLYSSNDLSFWSKWRVQRHLHSCPDCRQKQQEYSVVRAMLRNEADRMPEGVNWNQLSGEMAANIRLGLAAGECVASVPAKTAELTGFRPAFVLAGAVLVVAVAWFANYEKPNVPSNLVEIQRLTAEDKGIRLETTPTGVELRDNGRVLSLKHPKDRDVSYGMTLDTVRARYIDSETGQVTINKVYVQ